MTWKDMLGYVEVRLICYVGIPHSWIHSVVWTSQSTVGKKLTGNARIAGLRSFLPLTSSSCAPERTIVEVFNTPRLPICQCHTSPSADNIGYCTGLWNQPLLHLASETCTGWEYCNVDAGEFLVPSLMLILWTLEEGVLGSMLSCEIMITLFLEKCRVF